jgi:hypothetical protein
MFVELVPILSGRTVLITVAKMDDKTLRVNFPMSHTVFSVPYVVF